MGRKGKVIPARIIAKPPSAEAPARPKDEDFRCRPNPVLDAHPEGPDRSANLAADELGGRRLRSRDPSTAWAPARKRRVQSAARRRPGVQDHPRA